MLDLAVQAGLPLIKVVTDDTVNFHEVLETIAGEEVFEVNEADLNTLSSNKLWSGRVHYMFTPEMIDYTKAYKMCVDSEKTLVVVNPDEDDSAMFDAGIVRLPDEMLIGFLSEIADDDDIHHLKTALGGLSLKDTAEVCRLCMAENESLTPRGVTSVRRMYMTRIRGIHQVDTDYGFYDPDNRLNVWLGGSGKLFKEFDLPEELVPRGILFHGEPGTGKTMGAKYLADRLEVPLFRLDLAGMMAKYVGESENNLTQALQQVDQSEPCMLLIDEVEKIFQSSDDSGVTSRLLSQLLWWLQEHQSRVLTIMTTNDKAALPPELIRDGRIERKYLLTGLKSGAAEGFAKKLFDHLEPVLPKKVPKNLRSRCVSRILAMYTDTGPDSTETISHSRITARVYDEIKIAIAKTI